MYVLRTICGRLRLLSHGRLCILRIRTTIAINIYIGYTIDDVWVYVWQFFRRAYNATDKSAAFVIQNRVKLTISVICSESEVTITLSQLSACFRQGMHRELNHLCAKIMKSIVINNLLSRVVESQSQPLHEKNCMADFEKNS